MFAFFFLYHVQIHERHVTNIRIVLNRECATKEFVTVMECMLETANTAEVSKKKESKQIETFLLAKMSPVVVN